MTDKTDTSTEAVDVERLLEHAQRFIDHYFKNPDVKRPQITIPARQDDSDLILTRGIKAFAAERDALQARLSETEAALEWQIARAESAEARVTELEACAARDIACQEEHDLRARLADEDELRARLNEEE